MTDKTHTPGPWFLEVTSRSLWIGPKKAAGGKVGDVVVSVDCGPDYRIEYNETALANAALIAAAPELAHGAREALRFITNIDNSHPSVRLLREALAKAGVA